MGDLLLDQWVELIVQTVIIALIQALVIGFFLAGAATGSAAAIVGIGLVCLIFILITLWSGLKAVWNSFNRLFSAVGQAAGGVLIAPGTAMVGTAAAAVGGAALTAGVGSSALAGMGALRQGATPAQAAGIALGGFNGLAGAARTLSHLPGLRGTPLAEAAGQFSEGASARRIAGPLIGGLLLSDRDSEREGRSMLIPAVGERLASWTQPRKRRPDDLSDVEWLDNDRPQRMGVFMPIKEKNSDDRRTYADDQRGEELETHLTERLGSLRVSGREDIASVMGDVMRLLSGHGGMGVDHLSVGLTIAQALGVTPTSDTPPVRDDLSRFGLFIEQAARLGLSPEQTSQAAREINTTSDRRLPPETWTESLEQGVKSGMSRDEAERQLLRLEVTARLLPDSLTAHGAVVVQPQVSVNVQAPDDDDKGYDRAMDRQAALGGSGSVIRGGKS